MSIVLFVNSLKRQGFHNHWKSVANCNFGKLSCSFKAQDNYKMHTKRSGNFSKSFKLLPCGSRFLQTKTLFFCAHRRYWLL